MTRVAFTVFGGDGWTGGINYLRNLISALAEAPGRPVVPVLFVAPETPAAALAELTPYLDQPPVVVPGWAGDPTTRRRRLWHSAVLQSDRVSLQVFAQQRIDVVFVHMAWYGMRFPLPTIGWVADFQHRHLPQMFSLPNRMKRTQGYRALSRSVDVLMVSSQDAAKDCLRFFPRARGKIEVVPFCVRVDDEILAFDPTSVAHSHGLPDRFFFMPNQLWRHKNHLTVIEALHILKGRGVGVVVVSSGNPKDVRNPDHPAQVLARAKSYGLDAEFRFLGMIPYEHIMPLMRASIAVINPSLFEGWSTTVEEAKALGVPLLLSDLAVHREQTTGHPVRYFDPLSAPELADLLEAVGSGESAVWQRALPDEALARYRIARQNFAQRFRSVAERAVDKNRQRAHPG